MFTTTHEHHEDHHHGISTGYSKKDILYPLRRLVDGLEIRNRKIAHLICQVIPCCCPFERNITLFGRTYHIPPLCKLNPLYEEFVGLRFRALTYLSDICSEDIRKYIC